MSRLSQILMRQKFPSLILFFLLISRLASAQGGSQNALPPPASPPAQAPAAVPEEFPILGEVTSDAVSIRAGQSASFEKIGQLKTGDQVVVMAKDYGWYKIKLPLEAVKALLQQGLTLKEVARVSGYDKRDLSFMLKLWGMSRRRGRRKAQQ